MARVERIGQGVQEQLVDQLRQKLVHADPGHRKLPSAMLWGDSEAMTLFDTYSTIPEYYPTHDEINLMRHWGHDIAKYIVPGSLLVDLGCGNVSKVKPLLDHIEASRMPVTYYALDLSYESLVRNIESLQASNYEYVKCMGLCGTFEDVRSWVQRIEVPVCFVSFGSIFGNDEFDIAVRDLRVWSEAMRAQDKMLIGLDSCQDKDRIWRSYNTVVPGKETMVRHALELSNSTLNEQWYRPDDWEVVGIAEDNGGVCTHQWVIRALRDVHCDALGLQIVAGEEITTTKWFKWGPEGVAKQFEESGFDELDQWESPTGPFYQYLVRPQK